MVRILCLIDSLGPGGAQRQLVGLARLLKENGYDVIMACYHDDKFYVDQLLSHGIPYVFLKKAKKITFRIWYIARYIRRIKPDTVIAYLETPSICACIARIFNHRFHLIVSERNTTQHTGRKEKLRFNLFRNADYVVPNAYAQADYINKFFPFLINKVVTIPNYVDLHHFVPLEKKDQHVIPEIVVVASIWKSKNTLGFVEAVSLMKAKGLRFHISWYGKVDAQIDYYNQCQQKIEELGIGDFIELKEKTPHICGKYQSADFFCLPSFYEGTPNVICEAMACGLPIACSDVCDNSRYVEDGINGFLFDPHNIESIVRALERLLSLNASERQSFCEKSRQKAEALFSEEKFLYSYMKLFVQ